MSSFVIRIAIEVNRAVIDDITIPTFVLTIDKVLVIVETPPSIISEMI